MKQKQERKTRRNMLKIVSIIFILLFVSALVGVFINASRAPKFTEPTEEQAESAISIVSYELKAMSDSIENYEIAVTNRMMGFIEGGHGMRPVRSPGCMMESSGCHRNNIQVAVRNGSTTHLYIVDLDSGKIVMRSSTEWFDD